jgi:tetratricopeptide (TPR) repeat protein
VWQVVQYGEKEQYSNVNPWHEAITKAAQQLEPESLVFTASDSASSLFAFLQVANAARPDLAVVVRQHLFRASSTGPTFKRLKHALQGWQPGARLENLVHLNGEWPLAWEWADGLDAVSKPSLSEFAVPLMTRGQPRAARALKKWQSGTTDKLWTQRPQFVESMALTEVAIAVANGQPGSPHLAELLLWDSGNHLLWLRYAALLTSEGQLKTAQEVVRTALEIFPDDSALTEQQLRILIAQSQCVKAIEIADQIPDVQIGQNANILGLLGICYANMKDYRQAVQYFDKALKIDPAQYEARLYQPRVKSLLKQ